MVFKYEILIGMNGKNRYFFFIEVFEKETFKYVITGIFLFLLLREKSLFKVEGKCLRIVYWFLNVVFIY